MKRPAVVRMKGRGQAAFLFVKARGDEAHTW